MQNDATQLKTSKITNNNGQVNIPSVNFFNSKNKTLANTNNLSKIYTL